MGAPLRHSLCRCSTLRLKFSRRLNDIPVHNPISGMQADGKALAKEPLRTGELAKDIAARLRAAELEVEPPQACY